MKKTVVLELRGGDIELESESRVIDDLVRITVKEPDSVGSSITITRTDLNQLVDALNIL